MWELVYSEDGDVMERMEQQNGWLYRNQVRVGGSAHTGDYVWAIGLAWVPDTDKPGAMPADTLRGAMARRG